MNRQIGKIVRFMQSLCKYCPSCRPSMMLISSRTMPRSAGKKILRNRTDKGNQKISYKFPEYSPTELFFVQQ